MAHFTFQPEQMYISQALDEEGRQQMTNQCFPEWTNKPNLTQHETNMADIYSWIAGTDTNNQTAPDNGYAGEQEEAKPEIVAIPIIEMAPSYDQYETSFARKDTGANITCQIKQEASSPKVSPTPPLRIDTAGTMTDTKIIQEGKYNSDVHIDTVVRNFTERRLSMNLTYRNLGNHISYTTRNNEIKWLSKYCIKGFEEKSLGPKEMSKVAPIIIAWMRRFDDETVALFEQWQRE